MTPSIERIVQDLVSGGMLPGEASNHLHSHAEGSANRLRDEWAMAVATGIASNTKSKYKDHIAFVKDCYTIADLALAERSRERGRFE